MRRLAVVAAVLAWVAGCGPFGAGGESAPEPKMVGHVVLYEMHLLGGPGYKITLTYTDTTGDQKHEETSTPVWTREVTVHYPPVMLVAISGNAIPDPMDPPERGIGVPMVQCRLWVDGQVVDEDRSILPTCGATLSALAHPTSTPS